MNLIIIMFLSARCVSDEDNFQSLEFSISD